MSVNTEQPQYNLDARQGVTIAALTETDVVESTEGHVQETSARATSHMNEPGWDLVDMLHRYTLVTNVTWPASAAVGSTLATLDVIKDLLANNLISAPFQRFTYWRCKKIIVKFQLTASRFFQGRLLCSFRPTMTPKTVGASKVPNLYQAVQLQHVWLDPANGSTVELNIPFVFYKGYVNLAQNDVLGQVNVQVFNPYVAAAGSPADIFLKVWVSVEGSEFKVPIPGGSSLTYQQNRLAQLDLIEVQSGTFGKVGNNLGSQIDNLITKALPTNLIGDLVGGLLDKPQVSLNPELITHKNQGYLSNVVGPEYVEKLVLDPSAQTLVDSEHFGTEQDEMSIDYLLKQKMNYMATATWSTTQTIGTSLFTTPVGPLGTAPVNTLFTPTLIDFLATNFTHWRGALKLVFDVVSTQFHEGVLDFTFNPGTATTPSDYYAAISQYTSTFIVRNGQNHFEVVVPFLSETPWKRIYNGGALAIGNPNVLPFLNYFTGACSLLVAVPLKAPNTVSGSVSVNVFITAADDFEFNTPSFYGNMLSVNAV